jgi:hypothetical protein
VYSCILGRLDTGIAACMAAMHGTRIFKSQTDSDRMMYNTQPRLGKCHKQKARSKAQIRKLENPQTAEFCEHTHLLDPAIELFTHRPRMHASLVESCASRIQL